MANSEHLALIKQGVEVWNDWYKKHRRVVPDLSQANLSNFNLRGINLSKANLKQANLSNVDLSKSLLVNADLTKANLLGANLSDTNLKGANLDFVIFSQAIINRQTIIATKYLKVYQIVNNKVDKKDFAGIDLSNSNLFRADLNDAELSNAKLVNVNFNSANLSSAYLFKADLTGANLQNADLRNAYFSQANLTSTNLTSALCSGTYFKGADLKFANLKTAKFSQKTMIDLKWYSVWDIVNRGAAQKNLSGVDLSNANLQGVNFEGANLTNAKLSNSILRRSNLNNANLTNTDLVGANVCGVDLAQANLKGTKLKSVITDRHTQLSAVNNNHSKINKTNVAVKERPLDETKIIPTLPDSTEIQTNQTKVTNHSKVQTKPKSGKNLVGILFLVILAGAIAGAYIFHQQNPDFPWSEKLEQWQQKLE